MTFTQGWVGYLLILSCISMASAASFNGSMKGRTYFSSFLKLYRINFKCFWNFKGVFTILTCWYESSLQGHWGLSSTTASKCAFCNLYALISSILSLNGFGGMWAEYRSNHLRIHPTSSVSSHLSHTCVYHHTTSAMFDMFYIMDHEILLSFSIPFSSHYSDTSFICPKTFTIILPPPECLRLIYWLWRVFFSPRKDIGHHLLKLSSLGYQDLSVSELTTHLS